MKSKDSKAQLEVWQWKESAYEQIKDMPLNKAIEFIIEQTKPLTEILKANKQQKP